MDGVVLLMFVDVVMDVLCLIVGVGGMIECTSLFHFDNL